MADSKGKENDPHLKRLLVDNAEWHARLERLAKMRKLPADWEMQTQSLSPDLFG